MKTRYAASILVAALVGVSATGCAFITPQATTQISQVTDGVDGVVAPDLAVRNATLISDEKTSASLLVSLVNTGTEDHQVVVQYENSSGKSVDATVLVAAGQTLTVGAATGSTSTDSTEPAERIVLGDVDLTPGQLFPLYFQYGSVTGTKLLVPVLSSDWQQFDGLAPTATPTPTATPAARGLPTAAPTATASPQTDASATPTPAP